MQGLGYKVWDLERRFRAADADAMAFQNMLPPYHDPLKPLLELKPYTP